jgi:hypothetical protein
MKTGIKVNASGFLRKMKEFPQLLAREQESVLKQEARALSTRYAQCTAPAYGLAFDPAKAEGMKKRVESEVNRVFLTRAQGGRVYDAIKRRSPQLATAYWAAWKSKNTRAQTRIMREAGLAIGPLAPATHKAARTGSMARVPKSFQATEMVSQPQLRAYARRQAALVGFAQAGWYAAARGLGGRVRRNLVSATGKRSTAESFPPYIRKLANKHSGIGGARVLTSGSTTRVEIWTGVRHARAAMPDRLRTLAEDEARRKVASALLESVRAINRKKLHAA